eukprot:764008-Hanusia_phi.AAC.3
MEALIRDAHKRSMTTIQTEDKTSPSLTSANTSSSQEWISPILQDLDFFANVLQDKTRKQQQPPQQHSSQTRSNPGMFSFSELDYQHSLLPREDQITFNKIVSDICTAANLAIGDVDVLERMPNRKSHLFLTDELHEISRRQQKQQQHQQQQQQQHNPTPTVTSADLLQLQKYKGMCDEAEKTSLHAKVRRRKRRWRGGAGGAGRKEVEVAVEKGRKRGGK